MIGLLFLIWLLLKLEKKKFCFVFFISQPILLCDTLVSSYFGIFYYEKDQCYVLVTDFKVGSSGVVQATPN